MGIFSNFFGGAKDNMHIGNGVAKVQELLHDYELSKNLKYLIFAAYVTRIAILDTFEKRERDYNPAYICYAPINGHLTKITWLQANFMTVGKISAYLNDIDEYEREHILSILDKGDVFYDLDKRISYEEKKSFID